MNIARELREEKGRVLAAARKLNDQVVGQQRVMTAAETTQFDGLLLQLNDLSDRIERAEGRPGIMLRASRGNFPEVVAECQRPLNPVANPDTTPDHAAPSGWRTPEGGELRTFGKGESIAAHYRALRGGDNPCENFTFGDCMRALALGPRNGFETKMLLEGISESGGYTVPEVLSTELIDRLRARSVIFEAGARTVPLSTSKTTIASIDSDPVATWRGELQPVNQSDMTFGARVFYPRTLACIVRCSRELTEDSANLSEAVSLAFSGAMSGELDRAALFGVAPEPQGLVGILKAAGVTNVPMGDNGLALADYDPLVKALQVLNENNADTSNLAALMSPRTDMQFATLKADTEGQYLIKPPALANLRWLVTSKIGNTDVQGNANTCSRIFVGDFKNLLVGIRTQMTVEVLRERFADTLEFAFLAYLRADFCVGHAESFTQVLGIL